MVSKHEQCLRITSCQKGKVLCALSLKHPLCKQQQTQKLKGCSVVDSSEKVVDDKWDDV